ncbi:MAG: class I SAM-dependent methyltransferase [Candidatus Lokiarchaeota archaeon]|nr:class I SAM-dependent methyltransferase [Candidatus Lokiarchaeota archaeon]
MNVKGLFVSLYRSLKQLVNGRKFLLKLMPKHSICAEIGVYKGNFSDEILDLVEPRKLHLIDPWKYHDKDDYSTALFGGIAGSQDSMDDIYESVREKFKPELDKKIIDIHRDYSQDAYEEFPDEYFDWIYIDGNHKYEYVKKDLELYYPKVKKKGYITGDDYKKFGWWDGGVKKAVKEFMRENDVKKIKIKKSQFILKKI